MTDQPKPDPSAAPTCPRCGGELINCRLKFSGTFFLEPDDHHGFFDLRQSSVSAIACSNCGYIEFYATDPAQLLPRQ